MFRAKEIEVAFEFECARYLRLVSRISMTSDRFIDSFQLLNFYVREARIHQKGKKCGVFTI